MSYNILKELETYLSKSDNQKSSHWTHFLKDKKYKNIKQSFGFGTYTKTKVFKKFIHFLFQRIIFGNQFFKTEEYFLYKKFCLNQNKQIDVDVVRHIFTFNLLNKYNLLKNNICVIGDGKANFIGGLLTMNNPSIKIFSINLTEVLIHDYLLIKNSNLIHDDSIIVVKNKNDLNNSNKKLFLIDASNKNLLTNKKINLFININSMQEMRIDIIEHYFQIIKSNSSYFYCSNREYKKLIGGEELIFDEYPWGNCKKILWEDNPWNKKYYDSKLPFIKKYDGNHKHALVKYS